MSILRYAIAGCRWLDHAVPPPSEPIIAEKHQPKGAKRVRVFFAVSAIALLGGPWVTSLHGWVFLAGLVIPWVALGAHYFSEGTKHYLWYALGWATPIFTTFGFGLLISMRILEGSVLLLFLGPWLVVSFLLGSAFIGATVGRKFVRKS